MKRDKARDDQFFNCSNEHEVNYIAGLYEESKKVRDFLRLKCQDGSISYLTHKALYELIDAQLGCNVPE